MAQAQRLVVWAVAAMVTLTLAVCKPQTGRAGPIQSATPSPAASSGLLDPYRLLEVRPTDGALHLVSYDLPRVSVREALVLVAAEMRLPIRISQQVRGSVSLQVRGVRPVAALMHVLNQGSYPWFARGGYLVVGEKHPPPARRTRAMACGPLICPIPLEHLRAHGQLKALLDRVYLGALKVTLHEEQGFVVISAWQDAYVRDARDFITELDDDRTRPRRRAVDLFTR